MVKTMKAISLWQPWASLIATGAKKYETRSWPTKYRGPLLICAAKKGLNATELDNELKDPNISEALAPSDDMPFGMAVAIVDLVDCISTDDMTPAEIGNDKLFGDFSQGRFAWKLENLHRVSEPFHVTGRQGLFNVNDDEIIDRGARARLGLPVLWPVSQERLDRGLWWEKAWQLVEGCSHVSPGCNHCWSAAETRTRAAHGNKKISGPKQGLVDDGHFNGTIRLRTDNLEKPLQRSKPTVYAIWNDLFHKEVSDAFIYKVIEVIGECPQHTFIILTKRPDRMKDFEFKKITGELLPNVIAGTSVEDQATADERILELLKVKVAKRVVSYEPALEAVDFTSLRGRTVHVLTGFGKNRAVYDAGEILYNGLGLDWLIMGTESGADRRPLDIEAIRNVRDQCKEAGVPFFLKQMEVNGRLVKMPELDGQRYQEVPR